MPRYLPTRIAPSTAAFITPQSEKKCTSPADRGCISCGAGTEAGEAGLVPRTAIFKSPVLCASRIIPVSLRARSSGKLSATTTS